MIGESDKISLDIIKLTKIRLKKRNSQPKKDSGRIGTVKTQFSNVDIFYIHQNGSKKQNSQSKKGSGRVCTVLNKKKRKNAKN